MEVETAKPITEGTKYIYFNIISNKNNTYKIVILWNFIEIYFIAQSNETNVQFIAKKTFKDFIKDKYYEEDFNIFSLEELDNKIELKYNLKGKRNYIVELFINNNNY